MKITYNKLIRDKIPEIIAADGTSACEIRQLSEKEYLPALNAKLQEEVTEYLESENIEELADIEEVIRAILAAKHSSYDEMEKIRVEKKDKRGSFEKRMFLVSTMDTKDGCQKSIKTLADFTSLLEHEVTNTTYKYSLLRAVIESCQQYPQYVKSSTDNKRKILPLGICVMKWMMYYYPFFQNDMFIAMKNGELDVEGKKGVYFRPQFKQVCNDYKPLGGLSVFYRDIISGDINIRNELSKNNELAASSPQIQEHVCALVKKIMTAMEMGPIPKFGKSIRGKEYDIFDFRKSGKGIEANTLSLKDLIERCGTYSISTELWSLFTESGGYVLGDGTVMDKWLRFLVKNNRKISRDELLVRLSTLPVDERMVDDARKVYDTMVKKGLVCIWDNETKLEEMGSDSMEVDHMLPFSVWKSNALWNLLPACKKMNRDKLDNIPARRILEQRKERIFACWDALHAVYPTKFENEIATDLLKGSMVENWKELAFQQLCNISEYLIHTRGCQEWAGPKQS